MEIGSKSFEKIKNGAGNIGKVLLNIIYPQTCPVCQKIIPIGEGNICRDCLGKLKPIKNPRCLKCGKPLEEARIEYCRDCRRKKHSYDGGRCVFMYNKELRESIYRFKYNNKREYAQFYVDAMVLQCGDWIRRKQIDGILPVPLHEKRLLKRGFNQAQVLAEGLGKRLGVPVYSKYMVRQRNTVAQKQLNEKERQKNLKKAFKIVQNDVKLKRILLVDDIYTTGSTVDAVARELKEHGVSEVYFICLGTSGIN